MVQSWEGDMTTTLAILAPGLGVSQLDTAYSRLSAIEGCHIASAWDFWGIVDWHEKMRELGTVLDDNILAHKPDRVAIISHSYGTGPAFEVCKTRPDVVLFAYDPVWPDITVSTMLWPAGTRGVMFKAKRGALGIKQLNVPNAPDYREFDVGHNKIPHLTDTLVVIDEWVETGIITPP